MQSHHLQSQPTIGSDRALIETLEPRKLLAVAPPLIAGSGIPSPVFTGSNGSATVYDVTKSVFGATKNNNGDDDSDAINDAVARAVYDLYSPGSNEAFQRIIYFPAGQYWIDEPIVVPTYSEAASRLGLPQQSGKPARPEGSSIWFFGEGSGRNGGAVSKIVGRNKPVWQNANNPRGIIEFIDYDKDANSNPFTNTAFNNFVSGLEIVANGTGGQLGIVWAVNNTGAITDVKVNDNGQNSYAGITLSHRNSGPALIEDVEVIGFKTGIEVRNDPSQLSITDTTVRDQRNGGQGIFVDSKAVAIENLYSEQKRKIPAVKQQALVQNNGKPNPGQVTILNSEFRYDGSGDGEIALDNQGGHLYARNVDVIKYDTGKTIRDHGVMRTSGNTTGREIDNAGSNR
ncbi:MAG: glycosyl hydrolase family 28-related protein, partial [Planctomycetota bacterium]